MAGAADVVVSGPVVVFDDDNYYLGGLLAEKLRSQDHDVTLVTTASMVSPWSEYTLEQHFIQSRIIEAGIHIVASHNLVGFDGEQVELACVYSDRPKRLPCKSLVPVTAREPLDGLYRDLMADGDALRDSGIETVRCIGDAYAPGTIAAAVYAGHKYARELDAPAPVGIVDTRRERATITV